MKTKLMVVMVTLLFAVSMMAQTVPQGGTAPVAPADKANTCPCCSGDPAKRDPMAKGGTAADGKSCCGDSCCKDGKCDMAAHKDHAMANGKSCCGEGCCKDGKCAMASKDGKGGCCGDKCPMKQGAKSAKASGKDKGCCETAAVVSCCHTGAACCKGGYMPCCDKSAA